MRPATPPATPAAPAVSAVRRWAPVGIVLAGLAAYANSLSGAFVFDDLPGIVRNPTLRHLWPLSRVLTPPLGGLTVSGRPVLNLTLAFNYVLGGDRVEGYHLVNLAIHLLAGLTLYGIARRILRGRETLAWAAALIWTVHPLQTESVTYVIQRAESLMGLFYLLTLAGFIHYAEAQAGGAAGSRRAWLYGVTVGCCLLGMATKEVMVSAPVIAFLYDRTFLSGSFRAAWQRRAGIYLGMASTWLVLGGLVIGGGNRSGSVGFGVGVSWWAYGLTQFEAVAHYLRLAFWPHPLVFEYGTFWVRTAGEVVPGAIMVAGVVGGTAVALWRWPLWGFLGFWFLAILAPTSLVPGTTQMIVEHRMYLALAPLLLGIALGGDTLVRWAVPARAKAAATAWIVVLCGFAAGCMILTRARNRDYRTEVALWGDTVAKRPDNWLARNNLGAVLAKLPGRLDDAMAEYHAAVRLNPAYAEGYCNLGNALLQVPGRLNEAIAQLQRSIRLKPGYAEAHYNLGNAWLQVPGHLTDAIAEYQTAVRLYPDYAEARNNLGNAWLQVPGHGDEAVAQIERSLQLDPDNAQAHNNLGNALVGRPGREQEAREQYQEAIRLKPDFAEAHYNLGSWDLVRPELQAEAIAEFREAVRLDPNLVPGHFALGTALLRQPGRLPEAIAEFETAVRLKPDYPEAQFNLAGALLRMPGRRAEAVAHLAAYVRLRPADARAQQVLTALQAAGP